jgi:hypothetical protein
MLRTPAENLRSLIRRTRDIGVSINGKIPVRRQPKPGSNQIPSCIEPNHIHKLTGFAGL